MPLRRAPRVRAAPGDLALLADGGRAAHRAGGRHLPDRLGAVARVDDGATRPRGSRRRRAGARPCRRPAGPCAGSRRCCAAWRCARSCRRRRPGSSVRDRRQGAGAARRGPRSPRAWWSPAGPGTCRRSPSAARATRSRALLLRDAVDLDHDPVGLVVEVLAGLAPTPRRTRCTASTPSTRRAFGLTGKPSSRISSRLSLCVASPGTPTTW